MGNLIHWSYERGPASFNVCRTCAAEQVHIDADPDGLTRSERELVNMRILTPDTAKKGRKRRSLPGPVFNASCERHKPGDFVDEEQSE